MSKLTPTQISTLRRLSETGPSVVRGKQAEKLFNLNLIEPTTAKKDEYRLSGWGQQWVADYVRRTGNGPEDLKALFSFS